MSKISPLAIIEDGAIIGENVEIGPYCFISSQTTIGDGTTIAQNSCIYGKTTIGKLLHSHLKNEKKNEEELSP